MIFTSQSFLWIILLVALVTACRSGITSPSPAPSLTIIPTQTSVNYDGGQTACDHPYLPLALDTQWSYVTQICEISAKGSVDCKPQQRPENSNWVVTSVEGDTHNAVGFITPSDITGVYKLQCTDWGIIPNEHSADDTGYQMLHLPSVAFLTPGYTWDGYSSTIHAPLGTSTFTEKYMVKDLNPVAFDNKQYDGLQITKFISMDVKGGIGAGGFFLPDSYTARWKVMTYTLASGVGIVRINTQLGTTVYMSELVKHTP